MNPASHSLRYSRGRHIFGRSSAHFDAIHQRLLSVIQAFTHTLFSNKPFEISAEKQDYVINAACNIHHLSYRVSHLVADLGMVELDLGSTPGWWAATVAISYLLPRQGGETSQI